MLSKLKGKKLPSIFTVICALVIEIIVFTLTSPYFLTVKNVLNIGLYAAIVGVVSCSVTFINISGNIEQSLGSQIAAVGMVAAICSTKLGMPWYFTVLCALASGVLVGAINGFFITVLKLNAFISTIATMQVFRGFAYLITNGSSVTISDRSFIFIGRGYIGPIPCSLLIMAVTYVIFHLISKYTVFGRNVYMIGGNAQASFLSGIKVNRQRFALYVLNGLMCGVSGVLMAGGAALTGGKGTIFGTFLGSMVIAILNNGMTIIGIGVYWQEIVVGAVLLVAVSIDAIKGGSLKRKI